MQVELPAKYFIFKLSIEYKGCIRDRKGDRMKRGDQLLQPDEAAAREQHK